MLSKKSHKELFTKYLKQKGEKLEWKNWLEEEGFFRCHVCHWYFETVCCVEYYDPKRPDCPDEEAYTCVEHEQTLRKKWGIDEQGFPITIEIERTLNPLKISR